MTLFTLRDAPRVGGLDEAAVRRVVQATAFFRDDEVDVAAELVREASHRGIASGYRCIFADGPDGELLGYACFGEIACTLGSFDLYWIVVDPAAQGRGLGSALLMEVEQRVMHMGGRRVYIETSSQAKYAPTRAFYLRSGYVVDARLAEFYAPNDDKIIFVKPVGTASA